MADFPFGFGTFPATIGVVEVDHGLISGWVSLSKFLAVSSTGIAVALFAIAGMRVSKLIAICCHFIEFLPKQEAMATSAFLVCIRIFQDAMQFMMKTVFHAWTIDLPTTFRQPSPLDL